jgi:hypothetical protein
MKEPTTMQAVKTNLLAPLRWLTLALAFALGLSACSFKEETVGLSIVSYNHTTDRSITRLSVDGNMGIGTRPESGGGKFTCCVQMPKVWRPGLKVKIAWGYQGGTELPPPPPDQEVVVEVPKYGPNDLGLFAVHFYPDHKVMVLVTMMTIDHSKYPKELRWGAATLAQ